MQKLDVATSQQILAFGGAWRKDCYANCIVDLQEAISEGSDPPLCNELACLASRLADRNGRVEVKAFLRQLKEKNLLKSRTENFVTRPTNMERDERNTIYVHIGHRFFQRYMQADKRVPYGTIRVQLVNRTSKPIKRKTKKQLDAEKKLKKEEEAKKAESDSGSDSSDDDKSKASSSEEEKGDTDEEEEDDQKFSSEQRNLMLCLLMRFVFDSPGRATAVGKLLAELAIEKILDPKTVEYAMYLNMPELTKKVMNQLIKNGDNVPTPTLMMAIENGFETVRGERLEKLIMLAKRDDLPDEGCTLVGKQLATTGMLTDDKRRPFTQIEVRALLSDVEAESRREKILNGYKGEMRELSKLAMRSGTTPDASDNESDA
jgi:hypothetical protein